MVESCFETCDSLHSLDRKPQWLNLLQSFLIPVWGQISTSQTKFFFGTSAGPVVQITGRGAVYRLDWAYGPAPPRPNAKSTTCGTCFRNSRPHAAAGAGIACSTDLGSSGAVHLPIPAWTVLYAVPAPAGPGTTLDVAPVSTLCSPSLRPAGASTTFSVCLRPAGAWNPEQGKCGT